MNSSLTEGVHHIGLSVPELEETARFFLDYLGWSELRRDPDYPAIFVTDGANMVSLWGLDASSNNRSFDRTKNAGLHHVAFQVKSSKQLHHIYKLMKAAPDVSIEFGPEFLRDGPAQHMMCTEPGGIRVEFIWPGSGA